MKRNSISAILIVLALLLSFCACGKDTIKDSEQPKPPAKVSDADKKWVTDAYFAIFNDCSFFIPKINIDTPEVAEINKAIMDKYYDDVIDAEKNNVTIKTAWFYELNYDWWVVDDVVTLVIPYYARGYDEIYDIYNVDVKTGKPVTNAELMERTNITAEQLRSAVEASLARHFMEWFNLPNQYAVIPEVFESTLNKIDFGAKMPMYIGKDGFLYVSVRPEVGVEVSHVLLLVDPTQAEMPEFPKVDPASEKEVDVARIKIQFQNTQAALASCEVKNYGDAAIAYFSGGVLLMLNELPPQNGTDEPMEGEMNQFFYYQDGEVYFIFAVDALTGAEYRLYFDNGQLIRWIDPSGNIYDSNYRWSEMQGLYDHALSQCNSVISTY